ncbi:MAG: lysophospholipid acyltransferase family protein [Acetobacteraceae bacterium]
MNGEDDPRALRSASALRAFTLYARWYFWRNFHAVRLSRGGRPLVPADRAVIVCTNHPGWWDPLLFILLQDALFPDRFGYGPMDEAALEKYGFFRRLGIFGVELDSRRGAARFLAVSSRILADPRAMLWITAEGHFTDPRQRPVRLRPGIAHLARRNPGVAILPLAIEYTFWNERHPEALFRFGPVLEAGGEARVSDWVARLETALTQAMDALAHDSMTRDPALFEPILSGRAGVGGVYDLWRRARAFAAGQRFDPSHEGASQPKPASHAAHRGAGRCQGRDA